MNTLKKIADFILFGNIFVSFGACVLVKSTALQLGITGNILPYSLLVFFATLFIYNFQRVFYTPQENSSLDSIRRNWIFNHPGILKLLTIIGFSGVLVCLFFNPFRIVYYLSPLLLLSVAYFVPAVKLRRNAWFKLITLVLVWTMVTAVVPVFLYTPGPFSTSDVIHIALRFCFMMGICIPFDIRDMKIDTSDNISTLANLLGENKARWAAFGFMLLYIAMILSEYFLGILSIQMELSLLLSAFINTALVFATHSSRNEYFYVAGIDGTMLLQGVLVYSLTSF